MESIEQIEIEITEEIHKKAGFLERNKQIFELAFILALLFIVLTIISLILPNTKPELVPADEIEGSQPE